MNRIHAQFLILVLNFVICLNGTRFQFYFIFRRKKEIVVINLSYVRKYNYKTKIDRKNECCVLKNSGKYIPFLYARI